MAQKKQEDEFIYEQMYILYIVIYTVLGVYILQHKMRLNIYKNGPQHYYYFLYSHLFLFSLFISGTDWAFLIKV